MNSGQTRGACDDGRWGTGECTCFKGETGTEIEWEFLGPGCVDTAGDCPSGTEEVTTQSDGTVVEKLFVVASCQDCEAGKYREYGQASETCITCESGSFSEAGASECEPCPRGRYAISDGVCEDCAKGRYQDSEGIWKCWYILLDTCILQKFK